IIKVSRDEVAFEDVTYPIAVSPDASVTSAPVHGNTVGIWQRTGPCDIRSNVVAGDDGAHRSDPRNPNTYSPMAADNVALPGRICRRSAGPNARVRSTRLNVD